jgi:protein-disulfide isomerase
MAQKRMDAGQRKSSGVVNSSKGSKKGFYVLIAVVAVAGIAGLSYMSTQKKGPAPITLDQTLPPVTTQGYLIGSATAPLEVTEFGDFECPGCARFAEITEPDVRATLVNTGRIRFRFIDFPLVSIHRNTLNASVAAACADEQGQFWPMHDLLYSRQDEWNGEATANPDKVIKGLARGIPAIDAAKFDDCLDNRRTLGKVQSHLKLAEARQLNSTPSFIIGDRQFGIEILPIDEFKKVVDQAIAATASRIAKPLGLRGISPASRATVKTTRNP